MQVTRRVGWVKEQLNFRISKKSNLTTNHNKPREAGSDAALPFLRPEAPRDPRDNRFPRLSLTAKSPQIISQHFHYTIRWIYIW